jgi:hypothetical protein
MVSLIPRFSPQYSQLLIEKLRCGNYHSLPEITRLNPDAMPKKYRDLSQRLPFPRDMVDSQGVCHPFMRWKSPVHGDTLVVGWNRKTSTGWKHRCTIFVKDKPDSLLEIFETTERVAADGYSIDWSWEKFQYREKDSLLNDKVFAAAKTTILPRITIPPLEQLATDGHVILRNEKRSWL